MTNVKNQISNVNKVKKKLERTSGVPTVIFYKSGHMLTLEIGSNYVFVETKSTTMTTVKNKLMEQQTAYAKTQASFHSLIY